jgi:minor histocompatibility antigen H13
VKLPVPDGFAIDPVTRSPMKDAQIELTPAQMVGVVVGVAAATADLNANHLDFSLNNAIAACIVSDFLSVIGFGSFKSCATALCGLLAYDAFWVFKSEAVVGKNVMMSVAANASFNGPFRLLFPRFDDVLNPVAETAFPFSLLGLGDVAIPGLLIALMLRYDASRAGNLQARANAAADAFMEVFQSEKEEVASVENRFDENDASSGAYERDGYRTGIGKRAGDAAVAAYDDDSRTDAFDEPICVPSGLSGRAYFSSSLSAYVIGLLLAVAANVVTKEGQPALVYLVPTVLGVVAYVALGRGEADRVLDFEDETKDSLLRTGR